MVAVSTLGPSGLSPPPLSSQNIQSYEKIPHKLYRARGEAPTMSLALGTNPEGKERVNKQNRRIGSALVCVRGNAQHLELNLLESARFVLNTVLMVAVFTCGPTGYYPVSPSPLFSRNIQSHEMCVYASFFLLYSTALNVCIILTCCSCLSIGIYFEVINKTGPQSLLSHCCSR